MQPLFLIHGHYGISIERPKFSPDSSNLAQDWNYNKNYFCRVELTAEIFAWFLQCSSFLFPLCSLQSYSVEMKLTKVLWRGWFMLMLGFSFCAFFFLGFCPQFLATLDSWTLISDFSAHDDSCFLFLFLLEICPLCAAWTARIHSGRPGKM